MARWSNKTMGAITTLVSSVDGANSFALHKREGNPKGNRQDYEGPEVLGVRHEWVDEQIGGGMSGDEFGGTVSFVLGDYHLIVAYYT